MTATRSARKKQEKLILGTMTSSPARGKKQVNTSKDDTVTLARQEREKQGPWEVEVSCGGEADLHRHHDACEKNPGHVEFIPVDFFKADNLPSGYQHKDIAVHLIRAVSDLTVRVSVNCVSESRPEIFPESENPYPFSGNKGSNLMRVGTGLIWKVVKYTKKYNNKSCWCKECLNTPTPKTEFAHICLATAAHVVYDDLEGAHTTCHLFFDRGATPDVCGGVVTLSGMSRVKSNIEKDKSRLTYVSHDVGLIDRISRMVDHWKFLQRRLNCPTPQSTTDADPDSDSDFDLESGTNTFFAQRKPLPALWDALTFIVSHPHGCTKQVSVGYCIYIDRNKPDWTRFTYTTATCPGSSGAPVFVMGMKRFTFVDYYHLHSKKSEENRKHNQCGLGYETLNS